MNSRPTHEEMVLRTLRLGYHLTPLEALHHFGCARLSARIYDLKRKGYDIKSRMVETPPRSGVYVKEYWID